MTKPDLYILYAEAPSTDRLTVDRRHTLAGKKTLEWFFRRKRWVRIDSNGSVGQRIVEAAYAVRKLPEGEAALRILFIASKRNYRLAHDRNKIKRWLREAVAHTEGWSEIEGKNAERDAQICVMLKLSIPLVDLDWQRISSSTQKIADALLRVQSPEFLASKALP